MVDYNLTDATESSSKTEPVSGFSYRLIDNLDESDISNTER